MYLFWFQWKWLPLSSHILSVAQALTNEECEVELLLARDIISGIWREYDSEICIT
jgi:hypothetical protein